MNRLYTDITRLIYIVYTGIGNVKYLRFKHSQYKGDRERPRRKLSYIILKHYFATRLSKSIFS